MRLTHVEIRDYRSIFVDDAGQPLRLHLGVGTNTLVGQNNCGKSNVLRAISLALDPHHEFSADEDRPGPRPFSHPIITLGFTGAVNNPGDAAVLDAANAYERAVGTAPGSTRASDGKVFLQTAFVPSPGGVHREEMLLTPAHQRQTNLGEQRRLLEEALGRLREAVRFVLISSGESIESVLEGNFREILHSVVRERLRREFDAAERARLDYITGLQDSLLRPLRDRLASDVKGMFPEIDAIGLAPEVSSIEQTLSNVGVSLDDIVSTPLTGKGTGVRGGVLVAMLSYLALNATRSMVFAVEEPEAFLHPSSQEDLRDHLEHLAAAPGVTLLVTTHSPFTVTRSSAGRIFCLGKDRDGRTRLAESAPGNADHAPLIGSLMREPTFESLLASATGLPLGTDALVLVEGEGDRFCFALAADLVGRCDLLDGLCIKPTGGTSKMVAQAVVAKAAVDVPIIIMVDNDEDGRRVRSTLAGKTFGFDKKQILTYAELFDGEKWIQFPVEAEDLFAAELIEGFVKAHGDSIVDGTRRRPDGLFHYDFTQSAKQALTQWLTDEAQPAHVTKWIEALLAIRARAGLSVPDQPAEELVAAAPDRKSTAVGGVTPEGRVLIVTGRHDYARYLSTGALVLPADQQLPEGVTHVGFYAKAIQPHLPVIVADHPNLLFTAMTVEQLQGTGQSADRVVAALIKRALLSETNLVGQSHRVLLLSGPDDAETLQLDQAVQNTKTISGRPVAWTLGPRVVPLRLLATSPPTTDDLDRAMIEQGDD